MLDTKKDVNVGLKGDASASKMPTPVGGASVSSIGFHSAVDSSGSHFMIQPRAMHVTTSRPTDWRGGPAAGYELTGIISLIHTRAHTDTERLKMNAFFCRKNRSWSTPISRKWGLRATSRLRITFGVRKHCFVVDRCIISMYTRHCLLSANAVHSMHHPLEVISSENHMLVHFVSIFSCLHCSWHNCILGGWLFCV